MESLSQKVANQALQTIKEKNPENKKDLAKCAYFVRYSIQKAIIGGNNFDVSTGILRAKDYGPWLQKMGYQPTKKTYQNASIGDVAVLENTKNHYYGHIAIYCGQGKWVSDFEQNCFYIYKDGTKPPYIIYSL
ncbi:hypothetical protein PPERSA_02074 [Pseudocohnilembus persalinus]|uniref:CHAP domain-containing protein n=1 Tax=Pseudocohnilembus persalinus TaxID=266149 RepID=A0A0V0Q7T4_PSEPJ|nr:hypothetical protein PPERSA_02074 [Pseudocohnilembus persalinus]|eukprot:KRW98297.1 hypothetical protein PPERSA_02074 [Pseudocohnilembus persalinus]